MSLNVGLRESEYVRYYGSWRESRPGWRGVLLKRAVDRVERRQVVLPRGREGIWERCWNSCVRRRRTTPDNSNNISCPQKWLLILWEVNSSNDLWPWLHGRSFPTTRSYPICSSLWSPAPRQDPSSRHDFSKDSQTTQRLILGFNQRIKVNRQS